MSQSLSPGALRQPAVAGTFYPADAEILRQTVYDLLAEAAARAVPLPAPLKAIIVPHAGYVYSGAVAASAWHHLRPQRGTIRRVVLLGPSHRFALHGIALPSALRYGCPLGDFPCDRDALARLAGLPDVVTEDRAHLAEHALEVQLPFLRAVLGDVALVPLVVGSTSADAVAKVLATVWGGAETLIVVSTDLSHFLDNDSAHAFDAETVAGLACLDSTPLQRQNSACGRIPLAGLLTLARARGMETATLDVRTSGDTAGSPDRVVGYGAWALWERSGEQMQQAHHQLLVQHGDRLLQSARAALIAQTRGEDTAPLLDELRQIPALRQPGACFVTLTRNGALRGCIGSPVAWRSLAEDLLDNTRKAASSDPRFPPVTADEVASLHLSLSLLTAPAPFPVANRADLLARLRPGQDGLILSDGPRRALFLPSVWQQLPTAEQFVGHLWQKAGLPADHWSASVQVQRFASSHCSETRP